MKYFIDTEFIEGFYKPVFGKRRHFIDLISIGIVCEDGREYYAISNEFDIKRVWNTYQWGKTGKVDLPGINRSKEKKYWLRENVLFPIWKELEYKEYRTNDNEIANKFFEILDTLPENERVNFYYNKMCNNGFLLSEFTPNRLQALIKIFGKSNKQIAKEIIDFVNPHLSSSETINDNVFSDEYNRLHNMKAFPSKDNIPFDEFCAQPEFYGYYSDYDWVLFCSLFGTMMDLPTGFPMYCRDLKQMIDEWAMKHAPLTDSKTFDEALTQLKGNADYPKQTDEHNALSDARWNYELYKFMQS